MLFCATATNLVRPAPHRVANVAAGGGGAVLFQNVSSTHPNMTPTDNHPLPTVHMLHDVGQPLKDYLVANPGQVTVSFSGGSARYAPADSRVVPNMMASFSSRGPDPGRRRHHQTGCDGARRHYPGRCQSDSCRQSAAQGELFQSIMGTSMSSPHGGRHLCPGQAGPS